MESCLLTRLADDGLLHSADDDAVTQLTGVVTTVFGKVKDVSRNNRSSLKAKLQLYESIILSTLLIYSAELWPLTSLMKKAG